MHAACSYSQFLPALASPLLILPTCLRLFADVPNLAAEILRGNKAAAEAAVHAGSGSSEQPVNLKGFLVGECVVVVESGCSWERGGCSCALLPLPPLLPPSLPPPAGNAWTDARTDNRAAVDFWFTHAVTSQAATDGIGDYCDFSTAGPLLTQVRVRIRLPPAAAAAGVQATR